MPRPKTALIIDDEPHVRVYLRMLLKQLGITEILEAGDGEKALELVHTHNPDLVLLDIRMPGKSGPFVMGDIHAAKPNLPVIVVTAQVALKSVQEMHSMGAISYILKHTPRDQMVKMLTEAIDSLAGDEVGPG